MDEGMKMDSDWHDKLKAFCKANNIQSIDIVNKLTRDDYYEIAYRQHQFGASDRVVDMLLTRAAINAGLMPD